MSDWISVEDELPEDEEYVMVYAPRRMFSRCDTDVCQYSVKYGFDVSCVEYWMPLPVAPDNISE